jgi:hypothetical protein
LLLIWVVLALVITCAAVDCSFGVAYSHFITIPRYLAFARATLLPLAPLTKSSRIRSPSRHVRPQRIQVLSHPYHSVQNETKRVRFLQSGHVAAARHFMLGCGA